MFSCNNSKSRGVAILFNNNFDFEIKKTALDTHGNYILLLLKTCSTEILLVNIYGPNKDNPSFFEEIKNKITEFSTTNIIIGGDWNLVLNPSKDYYNYKHINNVKARETVLDLISDLFLIDIWRNVNPEVSRFTWRRPTPLQQSRLDYFLISENLLTNVKETDILYGYRTDHSLITVDLLITNESKRRTFWKFNSSLLRDHKYINIVKQTITEVKHQYAAFPYAQDFLEKIPPEDLHLTISDQLFLDVLIMKIREKTIYFSINKKRESDDKEEQLEKEIQSLEKEIPSDSNTRNLLEKKDKIQQMRKFKIDGIALRSRARWAYQGEKINKYFCNLEKRHYVSKQMLKLLTAKRDILTDTDDMLAATRIYYESLYKRRSVKEIDIQKYTTNLPKLNELESADLEGLITQQEATEALKKMQNDKSPGTDGITVNFLKFFWKDIRVFVVRSLNEGFQKGEMSITQKEGIITCIPKDDKPREYLKNWRPISLLNVIYKIGSACIANRIRTVLPKLIHEDQTGFVPGRYIGDNIRTLYDIMAYLENTNLSGLLVSIDFEKAFDSVDWSFMINVLRAFGFGNDICHWIATFYKNIKASVIVNGKVSRNFEIQRGCRQGDPVSPCLFVLCAEILANRIRADESIKGIRILDTEFKINQFADDTSFTLNGEKESYERLFATLKQFEDMSGLKLNYEKTVNAWLGQNKHSNTVYLPDTKMQWNPSKFKLLGIWFTNDLSEITKINTADTFLEVKQLFRIWSKRINTPLGRVAILKSLILSKLIYLWILLPNPPHKEITELQNLCFEFVWDKKTDRIKRIYTVQNVDNGGIDIPKIDIYIPALKLTWIKKLYTGKPKWKQILKANCPEIDTLDNYGSTHLLNSECNLFWKDTFNAFTLFSSNVTLGNEQEILSEPLFHNNRFQIGNKPFHFQKWTGKNIFFVKDLIDENGAFLNYTSFIKKYSVKINYLNYMGCINSVKMYIKRYGIEISDRLGLETHKTMQLISYGKNGARVFYNIMLEKICILNIQAFANWERKLDTAIDWETVAKYVKRIKDVKLKWLQIRVCHNILVTNNILKKMGITNNNNCTFCDKEKDSIQHYLWYCMHAHTFWKELEKNLQQKCKHCAHLNFNVELVLFGKDENTKTDEVLDQIILLAKYFVYKCKINKIKPSFNHFLVDLLTTYKAERYWFSLEMKYHDFVTKWCPYQDLITTRA